MYRLALVYVVLYAMLGCAVAVVDYVGHCRYSTYSFLGLRIHESIECIKAFGLGGTVKDETIGEVIIEEIVDDAFNGTLTD